MHPLIQIAYNWHGGGGSPLYSFASTGGCIHSEEHKERLLDEIEGDITWCDTIPPDDIQYEEVTKSRQDLLSLRNHVLDVRTFPHRLEPEHVEEQWELQVKQNAVSCEECGEPGSNGVAVYQHKIMTDPPQVRFLCYDCGVRALIGG